MVHRLQSRSLHAAAFNDSGTDGESDVTVPMCFANLLRILEALADFSSMIMMTTIVTKDMPGCAHHTVSNMLRSCVVASAAECANWGRHRAAASSLAS
jgi:hypothetical protein